MTPREPDQVKVLYIAGKGRSGSTLLARLLPFLPSVPHPPMRDAPTLPCITRFG